MCNPINIDNTQPRSQPKINLNTCKKGQKLLDRNGDIYTYDAPTQHDSDIHGLVDPADNYTYRWDNGRVNTSISGSYDIVEILPLEPKVDEVTAIITNTTVDEAEFQMWDKVNEEYYGVVTGMFARKLEDSNRKLITENDWLLNKIKQLENENTSHLAKIDHSRLEINRLITTGHKQVEVIDSREEELRAANKAIEKYKDRIEKLELSETAIKRKEYERRLIARGWHVETKGAYKGDWVNPANGWHYDFEIAITYL